jgi:hypothetical protein
MTACAHKGLIPLYVHLFFWLCKSVMSCKVYGSALHSRSSRKSVLLPVKYTATGNGKYKVYWYIQERYSPQLYTQGVVESLRNVSVIDTSISEVDTQQWK